MAALDRIVAASADTRGSEAGTASREAKGAGAGARPTEGAPLESAGAPKVEPGASEGAPFVGPGDVAGEPLLSGDGAVSKAPTGAEPRIQAEPERQRERGPADQVRTRSPRELGGQREEGPRFRSEPTPPTGTPFRRVAEPQMPSPAVRARPARTEPLTTAQAPGPARPRAEVREVVRERVIERSIVERLHTVREVPVAPSGSFGSTRSATTERGPLARASVPAGPSAVHVAKPEAPAPRQPSAREPVRSEPGVSREGNTERKVRAPNAAPVVAAREHEKPSVLRGEVARLVAPSDARRGTDREASRPRSPQVNAATRPAPAPLARAAAAVVPAPRKAESVPQRPKEAQARSAPQGGAGQSRERAAAAPHLAAPPRVHISIGRVEIRGKEAPSPVVRSAVSAPRSHEIDPGLPFGSFGGGRP